jgi:hypothetical protein
MSGPKVVRIVTREEIIAICEGHLRRLDQAIEVWVTSGKRIQELSDEEIAATMERRRQISALFAQNAFMDLQKQVPDEIAFLSADAGRRRQIAVDKIAQAKKRQRQGRDSATALITALKVRGIELPWELESSLNAIASGTSVQNADAALARGFALLAPQDATELSDTQRAAVSSLMTGMEGQDLTAWKLAHTSGAPNPRIERIDRQIAELGIILEMDMMAEFIARLRSIETMDIGSQQDLLLDSLILDLVSALDAAREHRVVFTELMALGADLRAYDLPAVALLERIDNCSSSTALSVVTELVDECKACVAQAQQSREADLRRDVILQGLAKLGYDVNEGMRTAWVRDGQVIAKKPSLPGYGVEIGGQAQSGRLQVRSVALTNNRDISRDKDVETIWCGEFTKLQELLAEHGDNLIIERALGVGTVPLKVVTDGAVDSQAAQSSRTLN